MRQLNKTISKIAGLINRISEFGGIFAGICILVASVIIFYGTFVRYALKHPTIWEIELSSYLLMMATFFAAASGLRHGAHVSVNFLIVRFSPKIRLWIEIISAVMALIFCLELTKKGWVMFHEALVNGWRSESLWSPPLCFPYSIMPLGMFLLSLQFLVLIGEKLKVVFTKGGVPGE